MPARGDRDIRRRLRRLINGAVTDAYRQHPEYVPAGVQNATIQNSIAKRIIGQIVSFMSCDEQRRVGVGVGTPSKPRDDRVSGLVGRSTRSDRAVPPRRSVREGGPG